MDVVYSGSHKITKRSLVGLAKIAIKSQIESSLHQVRDEISPDVQNFLAILENLFYHGLRRDKNIVGRKKPKHPWNLILQLSDPNCLAHISSVKLLDHLKNDFSKLRAWIKLCVMKCCLHTVMLDLVRKETSLINYYRQDAIFRSEEVFDIIHSLIGLENVQFNLDFKMEIMKLADIPPIDFSPFLSFRQSLETQLGAICECQNNEHITDDRNKCVWRRGFEKLKQNQSYSIEQQHYHEELIQKQFMQLDQHRDQLKHYKETTANLQSYILQLQVELTLIHEQYEQELKRLGVREPQLTAPTFHNISSRSHQMTYPSISNPRAKFTPYLNTLSNSINNPCMSSASTSQLPSILSVDQGVDALSLEYSSNPYDGSSYQSSTVGYDPGESKRYRSVRFSGSNSKVDQEIGVLYSSDRKIDSKRLPLPIRARSSSPASSNSLYSTISEFSSKQDHMKPKSSLKSSTLIRNRQKLEIPVNVQTIPAERFILPDNSYSNTSSPPSSPKNLDNMTVTVKPRSHNLFSCYVPKLSTNDVEGIIRHVDSLMNPQIANTSKTNSSVIMTTTSIVDSEPSDIGDGGVADRKNYCFNPDLPELDLLDSLTTSEIMETSSEYNSHERLHSTREYYQLTSEEDLNSGESVNYNLVEKKDDTVDDKEASIEQLIITSTKESDLKSTTTNVLDTDQHAVEEDV